MVVRRFCESFVSESRGVKEVLLELAPDMRRQTRNVGEVCKCIGIMAEFR